MGRGVAAAGASVLSLMAWGCNVTQPAPFDPREIQRIERQNATDVRTGPMAPLPTTMESYRAGQARTGHTEPTEVVRLPIREIMQRAAANSAEVRVAGYDPAVAATRVVENEAHYDPVFFTNLRFDKQFDRTPGTVIPDPTNPTRTITINIENNNVYTAESGVKQNLPTGGQVQVSYQTQQSDYFPARYIRNNYWDNELKLQLTQPLLREFGYGVNWARITIGRNDQRISMLDFRKALEDNTNELEKDYWTLYQAQKDVEIQRQLLEQTRDLANLLWQQYIIGGKATHVEASQGLAAVYQREATLARSVAHVQDISDDIKRRMNDPEFPIAGAEILAADDPVTEPVDFDLKDQLETAMLNRLELGQQQLRVSSAETAQQVAVNGLYPKLDVVTSVSLQGLSGNFADALADQFGSAHLIYSIGLQLEIPLGNREARAILRRAQLQRMQAAESYRNLVATIEADVTTAVREVKTTREELYSSRESRIREEDVLTGLNQRQASGVVPLDPTFVQLKLDQQQRLADSLRQETTAVANYNIAIARLEKAKGTILRYNNILMEEEQYPWNLPSTSPRMPRQ